VAQGTPPACFRLASGFRPGTLRDQGSTGAAGESASLPSLQGHQGFSPTRFAAKEWRVQCRRLHRTIRRTFAQPLGSTTDASLFLSNSVTTSPNTWTPRSPGSGEDSEQQGTRSGFGTVPRCHSLFRAWAISLRVAPGPRERQHRCSMAARMQPRSADS
jgi:hypothetical protein